MKQSPQIQARIKKSIAQTLVDCVIIENKHIPKYGYYVYAITENGKVCYIGKGCKGRVLQHFKRSSNETLRSRISNKPKNFDYTILKTYDDEWESLQYESDLIHDCKVCGHSLYNIHQFEFGIGDFNATIKWVMWLFEKFSNFVYKDRTDLGLWSTKRSVDGYFRIIGWTLENIREDRMPFYKGIPLRDIGYFLTKESYGGQTFDRVNICHKSHELNMLGK